ncbi:GNAT family N-acetyltransferase [Actinotalea sp. BY-33]|uniref:GNAT family N-acetyltransferase n=1 Tax=Actinotalea soli TaxID=2819234 RepID=A0A939RW44_9CELL|nr:GNAT family N-acetyltransferase [Actinotalea soli]MBO1752273.1 GNAT family N-acetyltransferase [Actinotalea soli]
MASIRPYRPADRAAVYAVCVRTAEDGGDARGLFSSDDLMPDVYAGPYLELEPGLAFVVEEDGTGAVVGYVLGTADTARWAVEHRRRWLPQVAPRYPLPTVLRTREDRLVDTLHHPERTVHAELGAYPAHLHVDLLPSHQGRGLGRGLVATFLGAVREGGATGFHLGVSPTNTAAQAFYRRLGLRRLEVGDPQALVLGGPTDLLA